MRKDALRSGHLQQAPIAVPFACGIFFIGFKLKSIKKFKQANELLQIYLLLDEMVLSTTMSDRGLPNNKIYNN